MNWSTRKEVFTLEQKRKRKRKQKKKSKLKYVLLAFIVLILAVGGYVLYELKFKKYDVADPAVEEIVKDNYVLELPDGTTVTIDSEGNIVENSSGTSPKESVNATNSENAQTTDSPINNSSSSTATKENQASTTADNNTQSNNTNENSTPTVASIKEKYMPTLNALEAQASSRLNGLLSSAASEYSSKKANGEEISIGYFYSKYMGAAQSLEAGTDAAFNGLISIVEQDLEANGFDKSHAQSFRDQYEAAKQARQDELLSKAKGFM